jgi:hypothetical protein
MSIVISMPPVLLFLSLLVQVVYTIPFLDMIDFWKIHYVYCHFHATSVVPVIVGSGSVYHSILGYEIFGIFIISIELLDSLVPTGINPPLNHQYHTYLPLQELLTVPRHHFPLLQQWKQFHLQVFFIWMPS